MALTNEQKQALEIVADLIKQLEDSLVVSAGLALLFKLEISNMSPREVLEQIGKELKAEHDHDSGCTCLERHHFLLNVLNNLEKQKFNDEVTYKLLSTAEDAWDTFEERYERIPTVTYTPSQFTIQTGVPGIYFIHPAVQK